MSTDMIKGGTRARRGWQNSLALFPVPLHLVWHLPGQPESDTAAAAGMWRELLVTCVCGIADPREGYHACLARLATHDLLDQSQSAGDGVVGPVTDAVLFGSLPALVRPLRGALSGGSVAAVTFGMLVVLHAARRLARHHSGEPSAEVRCKYGWG